MPSIKEVSALEILDSRGKPTLKVDVQTEGHKGTARVPSGASTGKFEAWELRDNDKDRYGGKGVLKAIGNVRTTIRDRILGMDVLDQSGIDQALCDLDESPDKNKRFIGANATIGVSLAVAHTAANVEGKELYEYMAANLNPDKPEACTLPVPMMNILNGGKHAETSNIELQEFMIVPAGLSSYSEALQAGAEIHSELKKLLDEKELSTGVGDEGGFAPHLGTNEDALDLIKEAIGRTKYKLGKDVFIALDSAASEFYNEENGKYKLKIKGELKEVTGDELIEFYEGLIDKYSIISIEDGFAQEDWASWEKFTERNGKRIQIVGDDLYVTNVKRLSEGIDRKATNAVLIKPNQIGTLSETIATMQMAKAAGQKLVVSHRSGETDDTTIADLSVAFETGQIKTGAPSRGERNAKYNRLLEIESKLGSKAKYLGVRAFAQAA